MRLPLLARMQCHRITDCTIDPPQDDGSNCSVLMMGFQLSFFQRPMAPSILPICWAFISNKNGNGKRHCDVLDESATAGKDAMLLETRSLHRSITRRWPNLFCSRAGLPASLFQCPMAPSLLPISCHPLRRPCLARAALHL